MRHRAVLLACFGLAAASAPAAAQCSGTVISVPISTGAGTDRATSTDYDNGYLVYLQTVTVDLTAATGATHQICARAGSTTFTGSWAKPSTDIQVRQTSPTAGSPVSMTTGNQQVASGKKTVVTLEVRIALAWASDTGDDVNPYTNQLIITVYR